MYNPQGQPKVYSEKQLATATNAAAMFARLREDQSDQAIRYVSAFIDGMKAQEALAATPKARKP